MKRMLQYRGALGQQSWPARQQSLMNRWVNSQPESSRSMNTFMAFFALEKYRILFLYPDCCWRLKRTSVQRKKPNIFFHLRTLTAGRMGWDEFQFISKVNTGWKLNGWHTATLQLPSCSLSRPHTNTHSRARLIGKELQLAPASLFVFYSVLFGIFLIANVFFSKFW